jgi:glycosyltransferase involved in cell wall biosynthesis
MPEFIFFLPSIKSGGGTRVIFELSNQLASLGYGVKIIYPNNNNDIASYSTDDRIKFEPVGEFAVTSLKKVYNLFSLLSHSNKSILKNSESILVFTDPIMSIFLPFVRKKNLYRFVQADDYSIFDDLFILKNNFFLFVFKFLTKISYNYNVKFFFNSRYSYNKFIQVSRKKIDCNIVSPSINHKIFFNKNIRKDNQVNLCLIARKHPMKGFIDFIKPFNLGKIHGVDNVYVISHDDLSEFDLSNVTLIKPKNDEEIAYFMNISHIFISTSWWEGFGLPALEAMACGCAVILTDAGGVNEYAIPNENCLMFEPKDQVQLVNHISTLVANPQLLKSLSENGIRKANEFSWERSAQQLLNCTINQTI